MPQLARPVGFGKPVPVRLPCNSERRHERREPVVGGDLAAGLHYLRLYLAEGVNAQTVHVVCGDLKRPIREGHVNPVRRRAERTPVGADHGV